MQLEFSCCLMACLKEATEGKGQKIPRLDRTWKERATVLVRTDEIVLSRFPSDDRVL